MGAKVDWVDLRLREDVSLRPRIRKTIHNVLMASRQCAMTPGILDSIARRAMQSGSKPLIAKTWSVLTELHTSLLQVEKC